MCIFAVVFDSKMFMGRKISNKRKNKEILIRYDSDCMEGYIYDNTQSKCIELNRQFSLSNFITNCIRRCMAIDGWICD